MKAQKDVWGVPVKQSMKESIPMSVSSTRTAYWERSDESVKCTITGGPAGQGRVVCSCVGCTVWRSRELSALPTNQLAAVLRAEERNDEGIR